MSIEIEEELKSFLLTEQEKLKAYAIDYHNHKNNLEFNITNIKNINDVEDKLNQHDRKIIDNIMQEHNYSKISFNL